MGQEGRPGNTNNYNGTNNGFAAQAGNINGGVHYHQNINNTPEPPRQNNNLRNGCLGCGALGFLLMILILVLSALTIPHAPQYGTPTTLGPTGPNSTGGVTPAQTPPMPPATHTVVYSVAGSDTANLILYFTDSGSNQIAHVPLPWTKTFTMPATAHLVLEAQSEGQYGPGQLTVTITVDGKVAKTNTGVGGAQAEEYVNSPTGG